MTDEELIADWKSLHSVISIYGCCGSSDIQAMAFVRNELNSRDHIDFKKLNDWAEQAQAEQSEREYAQAEYEVERDRDKNET